MSARQTFIPRALSSAPPSEPHPDGDNDMFVNGNGKARSIAAFLGQKRGTGTDTASTQGAGLGRANMRTNRRSFEGIWRPEITQMSVIPYPTTTEQLGAGVKHGTGQTPRKTAGPGAFEFSRPMTPVSAPRGLKKGLGIFAESQEDEVTLNGNAHGSGAMFMGPGGDVDVRIGGGTGIGGYMRALEGSGGAGSAGGIQSTLEHDMAAPVPRYELGGLGASPGDEEYEVDGIFARPSGSLDAMTEAEVGVERNDNSRRSLGGTKRGMRCEDMEGSGRYTDEGDHQGSSKRMKQVPHDPNVSDLFVECSISGPL